MLKNYGAVSFLGLLIMLNVANVWSKEYEFGQRFFPVLILSFSMPVICFGLYKRMRERAMLESVLLISFLALYALAYFFSETKNFGLSQFLAVTSSLLLYLTLAYGHTREPIREHTYEPAHEHAHERESVLEPSRAFPRNAHEQATAGGRAYTCDTLAHATRTLEPACEPARNILTSFISAGALISTLAGYYFFFTRPSARFYGAFLNIDSISDNWPNAFALFAIMVWPLLASRIAERTDKNTSENFATTHGALLRASSLQERRKETLATARVWQSKRENCGRKYVVQRLFSIQAAVLAILFSGFILTFSRAAYLVLILQLIFLAFIFFTKIGAKILLLPKGAEYIRMKPLRIKKILLHAVLIMATAIVLAIGAQWFRGELLSTINVTERLTFQTLEKTASISERLEFWKGGLKLALQKPLLGYGPSSFRFVYPGVQKTFLATADHPHNMIVKIAEEAGLPAAIILITFIAVTFAVIGKRIRFLEHRKKIAAIFFLVALLGGILHNLVDYNLNFLENLLIFWTILALLRSMTAFPHLSKLRTLPVVLMLAILLAGLGIFETRLLFFKKEGLAQEAAGNFEEGEKYMSAYEYTNFPRNYFIERADTFRAEGNLDLAETALKKQLKINSYDSEAWHRLGEIQREQERLHESFESFRQALSLNPKNHFWYWWNFLDAANRLGRRQEIEEKTPELLTLLAAYENQLTINLHFTRETPNAPASIALWKLLAEFYPEKSADFESHVF